MSPTSLSPLDLAFYGVTLVSVVILALGTVRAYQIARLFVNRTYRLRAYWGSGLMFVIMFGSALNFVTLPSSAVGVILGGVPFSVIILFLMAFLDQGIFVAMDGDIFHREILHWRSLRYAVYAVLIVSAVVQDVSYLLPVISSISADSLLVQLGSNQILVLVPVLFAYAVVALVIGGRRTSDRTMKRHIRLLGGGFVCFIVSFPFFASTDLGTLFANTLIIFANLFLYLAVMSLSSFGKVERLPPAGSEGAMASPSTPISSLMSYRPRTDPPAFFRLFRRRGMLSTGSKYYSRDGNVPESPPTQNGGN